MRDTAEERPNHFVDRPLNLGDLPSYCAPDFRIAAAAVTSSTDASPSRDTPTPTALRRQGPDAVTPGYTTATTTTTTATATNAATATISSSSSSSSDLPMILDFDSDSDDSEEQTRREPGAGEELEEEEEEDSTGSDDTMTDFDSDGDSDSDDGYYRPRRNVPVAASDRSNYHDGALVGTVSGTRCAFRPRGGDSANLARGDPGWAYERRPRDFGWTCCGLGPYSAGCRARTRTRNRRIARGTASGSGSGSGSGSSHGVLGDDGESRDGDDEGSSTETETEMEGAIWERIFEGLGPVG